VKIILLMITRSWSFYFFPALLAVAIVLGAVLGNYIYAGIIALVFILFYAIAILNLTFSQKNRNFFQAKKYTFNDGDISIETLRSKSVVKWDAFIKWKRIAGYYFIYLSNNNFHLIPKSAIGEGNVAGFEALLRSKIK
jgi:hypothetical protein